MFYTPILTVPLASSSYKTSAASSWSTLGFSPKLLLLRVGQREQRDGKQTQAYSGDGPTRTPTGTEMSCFHPAAWGCGTCWTSDSWQALRCSLLLFTHLAGTFSLSLSLLLQSLGWKPPSLEGRWVPSSGCSRKIALIGLRRQPRLSERPCVSSQDTPGMDYSKHGTY